MTPREWPDQNWMRAQDLAGSLTADKLLNVGKLAAAIAAAEERGRRAGITADLLDRVLHVLGKVAAGQEDSWTSTIARGVEIELRKAIAPRDSGKEG